MNTPIVYADAYTRWKSPPGRHRLIMEAMSKIHPVVFIDSPTSMKRLVQIQRPYAETIGPNLTLVHDAFTFRSSRLGRKLRKVGGLFHARWLHRLFHRLGFKDYIYWLSTPSQEMLWGMDTSRLIYDCIDPCFDPASQTRFDQVERAIANRARMVFCTAETLYDKVAAYHPATYLVPNACAPADYHAAAAPSRPMPASLQNRPRPIIGYMGTFDWRVDYATLTEAASRLPEYTFALAGRVNLDQEANVRSLRSLPNVVMPGAISEQEGHAFTAAFDIGLIPFTPGPMNDAINPVKMYMYLVAGKPVVSTWIHECQRHAPLVHATHSVDEFVAAIRQAVVQDTEKQRSARIAFALQNTWQERANRALDYIRMNGLLDGQPTVSRVEALTCR